MKTLCRISILFLLQSCAAQTSPSLQHKADNKSLLWEISGNHLKKNSYVFGTFHLMCKSDIHFSEQLKQAIQAADKVYFELDLDDASNTLGAIFFMNMRKDTALKDLYSPADYEKLTRFFSDSVNMSMLLLNRMKPALLEALIYPKMMACKNMSGIETELLTLAKIYKKEILGFETAAFQASVFDSIPYKQQAEDLLKTIDSFQKYRVYFNRMLKLYKEQDITQMEDLFSNPDFGLQENQDILLDKRNENWTAHLKEILPQHSLFIAVGAGHLIGEKGLINLLRKQGYILKPLLNK
ncbi:MAG: TraB/GumN family protein [Ferruginibacter sp.]